MMTFEIQHCLGALQFHTTNQTPLEETKRFFLHMESVSQRSLVENKGRQALTVEVSGERTEVRPAVRRAVDV